MDSRLRRSTQLSQSFRTISFPSTFAITILCTVCLLHTRHSLMTIPMIVMLYSFADVTITVVVDKPQIRVIATVWALYLLEDTVITSGGVDTPTDWVKERIVHMEHVLFKSFNLTPYYYQDSH